MPGIGKPLALRLFLEGVEVPVISAAVNIGTNAPATCSVQVIPLDEGMDLKPRTMVHLFYLDQTSLSDGELDLAKKRGIDPKEEGLKYHLFFAGEVVGFAFGQTPMSRSLVLQCLDFSSYWDACHATAIEYGPGGNAFYNQSAVYASNASQFDDIVNHQAEKLVSWLKSTPTTEGLKSVSGLAGGIITILEAIGGVPTHFKGVNDFFTFAELRCKILAQITAEERDNTASNLLSSKVFDEWLRNGIQNIGQQVTFRDIVKLLCNYIYYDFVPNPLAKYEPTIIGSTEQTVTTSSLNKNPVVLFVRASILGIVTGLTVAKGLDTSPPADALKNVATNNAEALKDTNSRLTILGSKVKELSSKILSAQTTLQDLASSIAKGSKSGDSILKSIDDALASLAGALEFIDGDAGNTKVVLSVGVTSSTTTARLRTQIFRPDCFFVPAPRCNVIFPEHYSQVSFDRTYLSEVTRSLTLGYSTLVGREQMFADKIMSPQIGLDMVKIQKQSGDAGYRILMPHERHTGIIPRSEWLPNVAAFAKSAGDTSAQLRGARLNWINRASLFHFFKYRFGPRRLNLSGKFNPFVVCGFPAVVILKPFIPDPTRLRDALKLQEGDTIDSGSKKVLDVVQRNGTAANPLGAPYQFVGMVGSVTHSIGQDGGTTSVSLHHARRHLGIDDEFLGVFSEQQRDTARIRIPVTSQDALSQNAAKDRDSLLRVLVGVTPQLKGKAGSKKISKQSVKTTSYTRDVVDPKTGKVVTKTQTQSTTQSRETTQTSSADLVNKNGRIDGVNRIVSIPSGGAAITTGSAAVFGGIGKILGVEVTDPSLVQITDGPFKGKQAYRAVIIHEEISVNVTELAPVEEILRPSWFSDKYSNPKIGSGIYDPFFGTTSIIDDLQFTGLVSDAIIHTDDPEGQTYDPKTTFQAIQKAESDTQTANNRLSIERAINVISYFYGLSKTGGKDVDKFIRDYCERPIATMVDVLGTSDLEISYDSKGVPSIQSGKPGFHSLALDWKGIQIGRMAGLLSNPDEQLTRINGEGAKEPISPVYDVRQEKLDRVNSYFVALIKGPGLQG